MKDDPEIYQLLSFLDEQVTRKAGSWEDVATCHPKPNKLFQQTVLSKLPIVQVSQDRMPQYPCEDFGFKVPQHFILQEVVRKGDEDIITEEYYIDTQGYDYARYALRLK